MTLKKFLKKAKKNLSIKNIGAVAAGVGAGILTGGTGTMAILAGGAGGLSGAGKKGSILKGFTGGLLAGSVSSLITGQGAVAKTILPKAKGLFGSAKTGVMGLLSGGKSSPTVTAGMASLEGERDAYLAGSGGSPITSLVNTAQGMTISSIGSSLLGEQDYATISGLLQGGASQPLPDKQPAPFPTGKVLLIAGGVLAAGTLVVLAVRAVRKK